MSTFSLTPDETPDDRAPGEGVDFTTSEGLRQVIAELTAHQAWSTSPVAAELMVYATGAYLAVARAWHRDPNDAAYEAFTAMITPSTLRAKDPWAVVTRAVALSIAAETLAERFLTSQDKARRPTKRPLTDPIRAGHYEDYLYDVHRHLLTGAREDGVDRVVRLSSVFLVATGWLPQPVERAVDYIAHRITGLRSRESAAETTANDLNIATRLGYDPDSWRGLVRLTVGRVPKNGEREMGLFARVLLGDDLAELLADQTLVAASQRLTRPRGQT